MCLLAAGLFKYGVTHYEPPKPRANMTIAMPTRPIVTFENAPEPLSLDGTDDVTDDVSLTDDVPLMLGVNDDGDDEAEED